MSELQADLQFYKAYCQARLAIAGRGDIAAAGRLTVEGDPAKLGELLGLLDAPDPAFAIVTP